jgi:cholest-4-en-3-one 26-monooxygenase
VTTTPSVCPFGPGFDFTDPDVLQRGVPITEFAELRKTASVWWNEQPAGTNVFDDDGYWVISRHQDIKEISRDNELWSTNEKGVVMRLPEGVTAEQLELTKALLINHDPPEHTRLRKLVSRLFTPRSVASLEEKLASAARDIVRAAAENDTGNFVDDIAMKLPLLAIADLIGVPEADREQLFAWTNAVMNTDDPDFDSDPMTAHAELMGYAYNMAEERRRCPADDIVTKLVEADIDGESLGETEFAFFVILLAVAGNETTRNAISHGLLALTEHPEQRALWLADPAGVAPTGVEEIVRWASPVIWMRRTVAEDTVLGGEELHPGDKLILFYNSANRDEDVFADPYRFDVRRHPNPHVGFGAAGPHFCLGAHLARQEIDVMFRQLFERLPDIQSAGPPDRLRSSFINGIKHLDCTFTPVGRLD